MGAAPGLSELEALPRRCRPFKVAARVVATDHALSSKKSKADPSAPSAKVEALAAGEVTPEEAATISGVLEARRGA